MPIQLDNITNLPAIKTYSPKFFSALLTGSGKKTGLLCETRNPIHVTNPNNPSPVGQHHLPWGDRKCKSTHNGVTTTVIPVNPISMPKYDSAAIMNNNVVINVPNVTSFLKIAHDPSMAQEVYLDVNPHVIVIQETEVSYGKATKEVKIYYHIALYTVRNSSRNNFAIRALDSSIRSTTNASENTVAHIYGQYLMDDMRNIKDILGLGNYTIDSQSIDDYIATYDLYNAMIKRSEEWQSTLDQTVIKFFESMHAHTQDTDIMHMIMHEIKRLEMYPIPLDIYTRIYQAMPTYFTRKERDILCKQNLNLLLSDTLNNLNSAKKSLPCIKTQTLAQPSHKPPFSPEQRNAITSTEPLIMVQAGAGTGKSTVILGRVDHMVDTGIDPKDIMVLSFTNAAADNITAKNANIKSMTIARMIHNIYSNNFPTHELSNVDTIRNSIEIHFKDDIALEFRKLLRSLMKNDNDCYTMLNNFIEDNYDRVIDILNTIKQTSLELEIIICYQQIDTFNEPTSVQSKYLIVDEVQDNSIFEFIYLLKYINKHKESLFIVGDCSQTLYEFRASNPRALNMLESSNIFKSHQLQTNYRSNQEILDFANITLKGIEANQYANIQLRANSLKPVTASSFKEKVKLQYEHIPKIREASEVIERAFIKNIKPYIDEKMQKGEKIACLAYSRNHVALMERTLKMLYPDKNIMSLVPAKVYSTTIFSEYIKRYWDELRFAPPQNIATLICDEIFQKLTYLVYDKDKAAASTQRLLTDWKTKYQTTIQNWTQQLIANRMSMDKFLLNVRDTMIEFEIQNNAAKQALISMRNEQNKRDQAYETADIILSTIHSAKGLEFDNVIILYRNESNMAEDKKRMYYVALTRAMRSEYILAYDTTIAPKIEADYELILESLAAPRGVSA